MRRVPRLTDRVKQLDLVVVAAADRPPRLAVARDLAARLGVDCVSDPTAPAAYRLIVGKERTELCDQTMKPGRGVLVDLSPVNLRTISRREPIAKAMGSGTRTVIDATAGMGRDAFRIACLGYEVTAIERSPVVAALLEDGLSRAMADETLRKTIGDRLRIVTGDAIEVLPTLPQADVVYLDPMFPPKRRTSALPKKEMQVLRALLGDDPNAQELFEVARRCARKRVAVKRPTHAPPIAGDDPTVSHEGKLARFDVYAVV